MLRRPRPAAFALSLLVAPALNAQPLPPAPGAPASRTIEGAGPQAAATLHGHIFDPAGAAVAGARVVAAASGGAPAASALSDRCLPAATSSPSPPMDSRPRRTSSPRPGLKSASRATSCSRLPRSAKPSP